MNRNIIITTMLPVWSMSKGQGGKALYSTIHAYIENGDDVYYITNQKNDYSKTKIDTKKVIYINQEWFEKLNNNKIIKKLKLNKIITYLFFKEFEYKSYKKLKEVIKIVEKPIIYAYEVQTVKSCKKISKKYNLPLITRFQGTIMSKYKDNMKNRLLKYPHIQALSTEADLVIMTDDGTQGNQVLKRYKNNSKILFIRNGVNILDNPIPSINKLELREKLNFPQNKTILLTVSRLVDWKRLDRSINAFNELGDKENYRLVIVGEGQERKKLEQLVEELNLKEYVIFIGAVKNEDVYKYMMACDIFLSFYDLSNVGNPLLEALCLGKPIITYNVGDTYTIIDNKNGILLDDVSAKNIAMTIEKLNTKSKLEEYSKNALEYSKKYLYSWKKRMNIELEKVDEIIRDYK